MPSHVPRAHHTQRGALQGPAPLQTCPKITWTRTGGLTVAHNWRRVSVWAVRQRRHTVNSYTPRRGLRRNVTLLLHQPEPPRRTRVELTLGADARAACMRSQVVTLQLGSYANFTGAHFWNAQDEAAGLAETQDTEGGDYSALDAGVLYRQANGPVSPALRLRTRLCATSLKHVSLRRVGRRTRRAWSCLTGRPHWEEWQLSRTRWRDDTR